MYSAARAEARGVKVPSEEDRRRAMAAAIREARSLRRLSQAELAKRIGVDVTTIGRIENGKLVPNLAAIWALADVLEVSVAQLVGEEQATPIASALVAPEVGSQHVTQAQLQSFRADLDTRFEKIEIALGIQDQE